MRIPRGEFRRSHAADDAAAVLRTALDEELTGYAIFEPQDALLLGGTTRGTVMFEDGVPALACSTECEVGSRDGLEGFAVTGPTRAAVHTVDVTELMDAHEVEAFRVPSDGPARVLVGDERLATKILDAAPVMHREESRDQSAIEAFLVDTGVIEEIRSEVREEARAKVSEWGLDDVLADDVDGSTAIDAGPDSH